MTKSTRARTDAFALSSSQHDASAPSQLTAEAFVARHAVLEQMAAQPQPARNPIWIKTESGQRLSVFQIGTLFGRE